MVRDKMIAMWFSVYKAGIVILFWNIFVVVFIVRVTMSTSVV